MEKVNTFIKISFFSFLVLLTMKLTNLTDLQWVYVCVPLFAILAIYGAAFVFGIFILVKHIKKVD